MTEIFVEVRGGVLVESYSSDPDMVVNIIDWDSISEDCEHMEAETVPCLPVAKMPTETMAAIQRTTQNI